MANPMTEIELRVWAITQAIAHHAGSGVVMEKIAAEAQHLLHWVKKTDEAPAKTEG